MSIYYEVTPDEIDINLEDKEVSFYVHSDDQGSVYMSLSFDQIREIAKKIEN